MFPPRRKLVFPWHFFGCNVCVRAKACMNSTSSNRESHRWERARPSTRVPKVRSSGAFRYLCLGHSDDMEVPSVVIVNVPGKDWDRNVPYFTGGLLSVPSGYLMNLSVPSGWARSMSCHGHSWYSFFLISSSPALTCLRLARYIGPKDAIF